MKMIYDDFNVQNYVDADQECRRLISEMTAIRKVKRIRQIELGELCGMSQSQIAKIEKGNVDLRLSSMLRILNAMGKTLVVVDKRDN